MSAEEKSWVAPVDAESDALVERVLAGDREAFGALVRRHQRGVWGMVSTIMVDRATADGLVQQSFVSAYEHLSQYRRGEDFGRWVRAIARNVARKELRRLSREHNHLTHYRAHLLTTTPEADDDADHARRERAVAALARCREQLRPEAERALKLRYEGGMDLEQMASALGRTVVATRQLLFRTRLALRGCLDKAMVAE